MKAFKSYPPRYAIPDSSIAVCPALSSYSAILIAQWMGAPPSILPVTLGVCVASQPISTPRHAQSFLYLGLASFEERSRQIEAATTLLDTMVTAAPSAAAHIARIRFAWRTGGREAGRNAFAEARRAPRSICSWHVYAAAAQVR